MLRVKHLLARKGGDIWSIEAEQPVLAAIQIMADRHVGALPVLRDGRLVGVVSERDYARKIMLHGKNSKETLVREIMSDRVAYVTPATTLDECMALMTERHFRHLPVLSETGEVLGVVSIGDLVKETISNQQMIISELERYISG